MKSPFKRTPRNPPSIPPGERIYAIGDIHGRLDLLDELLDRLDDDRHAFDATRTTLIFLGDYVDRGPESAQVLDRLTHVCDEYRTVCLKGNHEALLGEFLTDPETFSDWALVGGLTTLMSYGLSPPLQADSAQRLKLARDLRHAIPAYHLNFLASLPLYHVAGDFIFVHAGLRPGLPISQQIEPDLLWIRDEFLLFEKLFDKYVVHGHTPVVEPDVRSNRMNIDTGAYATGRLTCLVLEGDRFRFI
jgi:serine/threonine protein phosphatase 1